MTILAEFKSISNPLKKSYEVRLGNDGVTYCTCWGWKKNRTCTHLDAYHNELYKQAPQNKPVKHTVPGTDLEMIIKEAVKDAVDLLNQ